MPLNSHTPKVLLVEDNPDDESLTLRALRFLQPQPITFIARDGATAVAWLEQHLITERPNLVLLDLKLPKLDGKEVLRALLRLPGGAKVPVVIFSSSDDKTDVDSCILLGAREYVRKPVDYDEYMAAVGRIAGCYLEGLPTQAW